MRADERLLRAVSTRFVPACSTALAGVLAGLALVAPGQVTGATIAILATELLGMTAGFAAVLAINAERLDEVSRLGARSVAAGFMAPLFAGAASYLDPHAGLPAIAFLSALAGASAVVPTAPRLFRPSGRIAQFRPSADPTGA